jgi:hypothetical protein
LVIEQLLLFDFEFLLVCGCPDFDLLVDVLITFERLIKRMNISSKILDDILSHLVLVKERVELLFLLSEFLL